VPAYTHNMTETLTYWAQSGNTPSGGSTFTAPTEISGRWQQRQVLFRDAQGVERVSEAVVYVDRELMNGGYLFRGSSAAADPIAAGGKEIRAVQQSPSLGNEQTLHKVML
jgi:hypothetical protein